MTTILIAEDEFLIAFRLKAKAEQAGFSVTLVHSGAAATAKAIALQPDYVFLDIAMEERKAGIKAAFEIQKTWPDIKIYFLTSFEPQMFSEDLVNLRYIAFYDKMNFDTLLSQLTPVG